MKFAIIAAIILAVEALCWWVVSRERKEELRRRRQLEQEMKTRIKMIDEDLGTPLAGIQEV